MQFVSQAKLAHDTVWFRHRWPLVIAFLFITACGIRLYHANEPPLNFHATRQYRSLLIARGYFYENMTSIPEWKKQVASINKQRQGFLEPPIMEILVSAGYRIAGAERFWIPTLLSALFWLIGGGFLYMIAKKIADQDAALFSTAFYLFLPFAVVASRSFQPDPMMVMVLLASIFALLRYYDRPSKRGFAIAVSLAALAVFVKPVSLFAVVAVSVALAIWRHGIRRAIANPSFLVFSAFSLVPTVGFYIYGIFIAGFLRDQAQSSFLPQLLLDPFFWRGWLENIDRVVGLTAFIGALIGVLMFGPGLPRALMAGLWAGYAAFCLIFNYHIATHDYYHLQLVPIVALSIGPVVALVTHRLFDTHKAWYWRTTIWSLALLALLLSVGVARTRLLNPGYENEVRIAQEIGERVNHSTNTVYLSADYGLPLEYHGELSGLPWPLVSDLEWERLAGVPVLDAEQRFDDWFAKDSPKYFIVEDLREFEQQVDLKQFLTQNFSVVAQNDDYLIFDLRRSSISKQR